MLESLSDFGVFYGLQVRNRNVSGLGFTDDTLMFLKADSHNLSTCLTLLGMYGDAFDLTLNLSKPSLNDVSASGFAALNWLGKQIG